MYTFLIVLLMLAVVLAPLALDLLLSFKEARLQRFASAVKQNEGPHLVWASPRLR